MKFFERKRDIPVKNKKIKLGLALGGGGARGVAHIGVLKAFEENGITFDFVAGTSAGSIVGAMYSFGKTPEEMLKIARTLDVKDIRKSKFFMPSKTDGIEDLIKQNLGDVDISQSKIPFSAIAVDLISSREIAFTRGNLSKVVAGSCAVPGVFVPVEYEDMHLSDGGLQNNIPSDVPRHFGCDYVVAVDVNSTRGYGTSSLKVLDVILATIRIMSKSNCNKGYLNADIVVAPSMKEYKSTKIDDIDAMYAEGYQAGLEAVPKILELISKKPKKAHKIRFKIASEQKQKIV